VQQPNSATRDGNSASAASRQPDNSATRHLRHLGNPTTRQLGNPQLRLLHSQLQQRVNPRLCGICGISAT
jgi:hypothetical protein